jgi:hypothetical protein
MILSTTYLTGTLEDPGEGFGKVKMMKIKQALMKRFGLF